MRKPNCIYPLDERVDFSIIYHELWDCYLPYLGPAATLLYCFLMRQVRYGLGGPSSPNWQAEVCAPLGMSLVDSHQAWARLQEFSLVLANSDGSYSLASPRRKADFQEAFKDFMPVQQKLAPVSLEPSIKAEATARALRRNRSEKTLFSVIEQEFGRALSMTEMEKVLALEKAHPRELIELATEMAIIAQARSLNYVEQILINWQLKGIKTPQDARHDAEQHRLQKAKRSTRGKNKAKADAATAEANPWDDLDLYRVRPKGDSQ